MMGKLNKEPIERFNERYSVNESSGCWEWKYKMFPNGYGRFYVNKKSVKAHRFAYETFVGPLIEGLVIAHNCNNRKCVRPDHLRQDTQKSNMIDMALYGNCKDQVLSVEEVIEIKKQLNNYYKGQIQDIAHFYKVSARLIDYIKRGKRWSHIVI